MLTVNVLPTYQGWTQMRADVLSGWQQAARVLSPAGITRIGLRYINFVPKAQHDLPGDWFAANDYVATAVLNSRPGLLSRSEVRGKTMDRIVVTLGESIERSDYVLDIDCIREAEQGTYLSLDDTLSDLHDVAWAIFSGFISPRLRVYLAGGGS
jgi:uncharacterized protein (TIGR04255 family)